MLFAKGIRHVQQTGYVTKDRYFSVMLWNGTKSPSTLTALSFGGDSEGISASVTPPKVIEAGGSLRINITVSLDGPLQFEALLAFISSCAANQDLTIIGTRKPHLASNVGYLFFPHNWEDGLDESLAWKTDVLIAHDRTEQRVQLRTRPRRTLELRLVVAGAGRRKLETWLGMRKTRSLFAPVWRDVGRTTAEIPSDSSTVPVDTAYMDYSVDRWIAVFDAWDNFEIRTVTGIGPGYVAVDAPFALRWPEGSRVAPCRYGLALQQRRISRFTEEVGDYQMSFEALDESLMPAMATPELYRDVMVCPFTPSWESPEESLDNKWVRLDNETGIVEFDLQSIEPVLAREISFLITGRERIDTMLRFLFACRGRLAPFWLPANDRGFELAVPAAEGASTLTIQNIAYEYALSGSAARSHIELITTEGLVIRRMITDMATLPSGEEQLTLHTGLPVAVSPSSLNRCAWLELVRLDSDEVHLHWIAWDCLRVSLPIMVLP